MNTRLSLIAALIAISLAACSDGNADTGAHEKKQPVIVRQLSSLDVIWAAPKPLAATLPFTGALNALSTSSLASEVDARVRDVSVREGERVRKGQLLAVLDTEVLGQSVEEQSAQLDNTKARLKLAKVKLDKQKELLDKGFISQVAYDELESDYRVKEGEVRAQASQLARAKRQLSDTQVKAPIDGVVYERKINPGEVANRGMKLFSLADLSVMEVAATVPARAVAQLKEGQEARFRVDGNQEQIIGKVVRINPVAQSGTRSFTLYVRVDNRDGRLKAGQFVTGGVVLRNIDHQMVLPVTAVHDLNAKPWVIVVQQGKLVKRPVAVLLNSDSERQVAVSGVSAGEPVLAVELLGVKLGDPVKLPPAKA
ncbi:efflux RND transporter periplasmic adaptor subunit [Chromobacterium sp. IIBBL 290-4]|uniref:efflux RND transporter periplasmic adaptor subunit n=1 Tax=Chromobacterium sp. IIBBL 290-4 TaxID=2953890 RepID=UPI0020B7FE87|nr:efflux RND transporter periplasmic adaptor subunit [Chromobacterium sp. IIBBL 290-4]UTH73091.1 efflux RND transporter periplasmic adaptor subunit [Chromobacterium sp. IIBBL 290-4]